MKSNKSSAQLQVVSSSVDFMFQVKYLLTIGATQVWTIWTNQTEDDSLLHCTVSAEMTVTLFSNNKKRQNI